MPSCANDFIAKFRDRYDQATKAGVTSITIVGTSSQHIEDAEGELGADPNAEPRRRSMNPPVVYYHLKPNGDIKALEKVMTQDLPEKQAHDVRFEQMENWAVMHQKNQTPPAKVDADRTRAFADALATIPEAAIGLVFIPDAKTKTEMSKTAARAETPKLLKDALPALSGSKWLTLAIALGNDPGIKLSANTADTKSAKTLNDTVNSALDDLKDKAANPGQGGGPMAFIGPMIAPLLDGLRPATNGNAVTVNLKGQPLNSIANLIATFSAMRPPQPKAIPGTQKPGEKQ